MLGVVLPQGLLPLHQCLRFGIFSRHRSFKPDEFLGSESSKRVYASTLGETNNNSMREWGNETCWNLFGAVASKISESWCLDAWHQKCNNEVIERKVWYPGWVCSPLMQQSGAAHPCTRWSIAPWFVKRKNPRTSAVYQPLPPRSQVYRILIYFFCGVKSSANMATFQWMVKCLASRMIVVILSILLCHKVADLSPIHFRKRSHRWYLAGYKYWFPGFGGLIQGQI